MAAAEYGSLPFQEQIDFFRQKVPLGTRAWDDIWEGEHARAFVIAGATKDELLADFRSSIDKAISEGTTLETFRKDFDSIVAKHGWSYNGGRGWRTRVIYETNLRTSYQAARFKQMEEIKSLRPFWEYRHSDLVNDPRPEHLAWDGLVLSADDPWWKTHYPPNGWGCQCTVFALSQRDLDLMGKTAPDTAPPVEYEGKTVGVRGPNPRTLEVPKGIDPGWGYNPGEAAWGRTLSDDAMDAWRKQGADAYERLTLGDWQSAARPALIPSDPLPAPLAARLSDRSEVAALMRGLLGGPSKIVRTPAGVSVNVDAEVVANHIEPTRSQYLPLLVSTLAEPFEVWTAFERHKGTGLVVLRYRFIKRVATGDKQGQLLVAQSRLGVLEAWTFVPTDRLSYLQKQRYGKLLYGR